MAPKPEQFKKQSTHVAQRLTAESNFVNTISLVDKITIDFVWYPGARPGDLDQSLVQVPPHDVAYSWTTDGPKGPATSKHIMTSGRVTLPLPPGASGVLNIFDTEWKITRAAKGVDMTPINDTTSFGVLSRLNRLGYHLRNPGHLGDYNPAVYHWNGERAVLSFQVDYRQPSPARGGPAGPLPLRGEWTENPEHDASRPS